MSDHAQQVSKAAPTRAPAARVATTEPLQDEFADLSDLRPRLGNRATAALVASALTEGGQPLGPSLRAEMERRFAHDFVGVRIHTGNLAAESASAVQALAYTVGHDIIFGAGQDPDSSSGRDVLMHELGHVVEHGPAPLPRGGSLIVGPVRDRAEREADQLAGAARRAGEAGPGRVGTEASGGGRRDGQGPPMGDARVVRRQPSQHQPKSHVPVIPTPPESGVVHDVTDFLGRSFTIAAARAGVVVISGRTMRLYRNEQRQATIRLAANSYPLSPGYYGPGRPNPDGTRAVEQLFQGDHQDWLPISRTDLDPVLSSRIDLPVPTDEAAYKRFRDSVDMPLVWAVLQLPRVGSGENSGGGGGGANEETEPLPAWATRINTLVQARLNSEHLRLATLAKDTIGDLRPETLRRMWAAEGVPKRLALGRTDTTPAEQVTVERMKDSGTAEASAAVRLNEHDEADVVWERILTAGRSLYAGAEQAGAATAPEPDPIGVPGEDKVDPDAVPPNQKPYPSSIRYYGPALGVTGVPLHFTMSLDWSIEGEFAVFGPMALRGYAWRFVRIQDTAGTAVDEAARRARRREAGAATLQKGFGDIGEDLGSSSAAELLAAHDLAAVDAVVRGAGTLIRSFVALASQPNNEQVIRFDRSGVYLVTCVSSHGPVYATEDNPTPFVRAPSVAAYTLRVQSPQELARSMVAPTQLEAARASLVELAGKAQQAPSDQQADAQQAVRDQQAQVDRLVAVERSSLPELLRTQVAATRQQIELVRRLTQLESTGTPPNTWTDFEARVLLVELKMKHLTVKGELARLQAAVTQMEVQQRTLGEVSDLKDAGYHPQVAFVPDADGRVLPVVMQLAERSDSTVAHQHWVLVDVSVSGHRDLYEGGSSSRGAVGRAEAIARAFEDFAGKVPYGRGEIGIRLPDVLLEQLEGNTVPTRLRAHPGVTERFWQRLESLATAAAIAGLVVTGPAAVALGVVGGVAGGAVASHRMYRRYEGGYLELDLTTTMDVFAIVGAAASIAGPIAGAVPASSKFVRTAGWVERGVEIYGYVQLGTSIIMVPVSYVQRLKAIPAGASPGERAALAAEAFLDAANQSLQLAVNAAQMIRHASTPREGRGSGEPDLPPARETPAVEAGPGESHSPVEQRRPTEERRSAQERRPTEDARTGEPAKAADTPASSAHDGLEQVAIEHGMVIMAPEGRSLSRRYATDLFGNAVGSTPFAEVALLRNVESGDFLVVIGDEAAVQLGESNPDWHEILPERARTGRWVLEEHSHAADHLTRQTPNRGRWPSGPDGDFLVVVAEARRTGRAAHGRIRVYSAGGQQVTEYAYHPGTARPYEVAIALPGGKRYQKRYATIEDYLADFSAKTGEPVPQIPDDFPGARRTQLALPAAAPGSTPPTAPGGAGAPRPVGPGQDVPSPARVPGPRAGEAPPVRNRRQELTAREQAAREAAETGDPARIAEANERLLDFDRELRAGLEDTDFSAQHAAMMADAGLDVAQMRALRAFAGKRANAVVARTTLGTLRDVAEFAARIEPLLGEPTTQAALAHLQEAGTTNPKTIAENLRDVPAEQLPALLRVLADPLLQLRGLQKQHWKLLSNPQVVALLDTYGSAIWRGLYKSELGGRSHTVLERLAARVAEAPAEAEALVNAVMTARTTRAQERVLDIPAPPRAPRQQRGLEIKAARDDALWEGYLTDARTFVDTHHEWRDWATTRGENPPTRGELIERVATISQIRSLARRGQYSHLTREQRLMLLDDYIRFTRDTGFTGDFIGPGNQASGALSEALFLPPGARRGVRLPHTPLDPSIPIDPAKRLETTLPDYELPSADRVVAGVRNFVEQKSNRLSTERGTDVDAGDVNLAKRHLTDAKKDQPGIAAAAAETLPGFEAPAGGAVHLIEYVRTPSTATREAMYDVLLGPDSPLTAVKFGDLPWMTRAEWTAQRGLPTAAR
ncbi:MAG: DUF4157 domain-containing protein [Humibacillus sp.]|uniref:eCIS core domain-containing protein n=1 Tax=Intrasporangium sp. TaxID=1925024 RepID=UPI0026489D56|nr:DUF4157 domain-containing protein [Intrasporangium sp.]MDN5768655.1 DUF4157 domain-containing protein [Humibacillus sp.]MDN5778765.1 DUF4157 domain-containing protein [Humibacillus sp.]MDN5795395.1 DUF4157 domain-containing protein [Intrasporangium sp.]